MERTTESQLQQAEIGEKKKEDEQLKAVVQLSAKIVFDTQGILAT